MTKNVTLFLIATALLGMNANANATPSNWTKLMDAKTMNFDFIAPVVADETVPPKQGGSIFFNAADNQFQGFDPFGNMQVLTTTNTTGFYGKIKYVGAASCDWTVNSSNSFADYPFNTNCDSNPSITGNVSRPTNYASQPIPAVVIDADDVSTYKFTATGWFYQVAAGANCAWRFSDGTDASDETGTLSASAGSIIIPQLSGTIKFSSPGAKTVRVQATGNGSAYSCDVANPYGHLNFTITVEKLPPTT